MAAARTVTYEEILRNIKAQKIAPVYYLMGEEDYYIDRLSDAIVDAVLAEEEKDFNLDIVYGAETNVDKVIELAHAYPMMAERRVVLIREAQAIRSLDGLEAYLAHLTPTTVLVFCHKHGKLDMRKAAAKAIQEVGVVFESRKLPFFFDDRVLGRDKCECTRHNEQHQSDADQKECAEARAIVGMF